MNYNKEPTLADSIQLSEYNSFDSEDQEQNYYELSSNESIGVFGDPFDRSHSSLNHLLYLQNLSPNTILTSLKYPQLYKSSTSTGMPRNGSKRCPISGMEIENDPFKICTRIQEFKSMGVGYYTFFIFLIGVISMTVFPLGARACYSMYIYSLGADCTGTNDFSKLQELIQKAKDESQLNLQQNSDAAVYRQLSCNCILINRPVTALQ